MKKLLILLFSILISFNLGGCTGGFLDGGMYYPGGSSFIYPDGREGIAVSCGTSAEKCHVQAEKKCPKGYEVISLDKLATATFYPVYRHLLEAKCNK